MSNKHCCLCCTPSPCNSNYKIMQNEIGESTEIYDVTVKYFDPMILTDDTATSAKYLCSKCWTHIDDFHEFQKTVLRCRSLTEQIARKIVVLPTENKSFMSEDDFSDKEAIDFDSDLDFVPLSKLCTKEKILSAPPDKDILKATREKANTNVKKFSNDSRDHSIEFDQIREHCMPDLENENRNVVMPMTIDMKYEEREEEQLIALDVEFLPEDTCNENEFSDLISVLDDDKDTVEITKKDDSEDLEISDDCNLKNSKKSKRESYINDDVRNNGIHSKRKTPKGRSRSRLKKSEVVVSSESDSSFAISKIKLGAKDSSRAVYTLEKGRESDTFIAQWKPILECDLCPETATNFDMLRSHFREVHKSRFYIKCCDRKFYRRCILVDHIRLHVNPDTHKCDICGKPSTSKYNLKLHKQIVHNEVREFECEICHKNFNHKPTLDRHLLTHVKGDKEFFCKECGKGYVLEVQLNTHMRNVHNGVRVCEQCGKTFHSVGALKKHLMEHGIIPQPKFPCDACGAELKSNEALKRHKAAYHHDGSTVYVCSICGKVAASEHALLSHKKFVHEDKRKHKCSFCDKAFRTPIVLREHIATHTGEDLYQCPHCPQTFKTNANMHHHRKRVHPNEWKEARKNRLNLPKVNVDQLRRQVIL